MKTNKWLFLIFGIITTSFSILLTNTLSSEVSNLFSGSGNCELCHSGSEGVLINSEGRDVSPIYHWQSSMMANSVKDPYWQAKVSSEVEENAHLQEIIEDKCATCHAPMGRTEALFNGASHFTFNQLKSDPLSLDGVSCTLCHQIDPENLASSESFSGQYKILPIKNIYGPYENPFTVSMVNNTGYTPVHGSHINSSAVCATCHTLSTPYVDHNGIVSGYFPEQMPYYEWLNSDYPADETSCQNCHMPAVSEDLRIASLPPNLQNKRNPVFEHHFVGGNAFMNQLMKENASELELDCGTENLDTTTHYTIKNLKENAIELNASAKYIDQNVLVEIEILNKSGHKIPTGFPSRRMWIHFIAIDQDDQLIFESGSYNTNGEITAFEGFQAHHDTIRSQTDTQIYEAVLGNTLNEPTSILIEASQYLKDNRIPPKGFVSGQTYDSLIAVTGEAVNDINFNKTPEGIEGTGSDAVYFQFPFTGSELFYRIEICYQSIKPDFARHLSESTTEESVRFTEMYNSAEADKIEVIADIENQLILNDIKHTHTKKINIYPNPANEFVNIEEHNKLSLQYTLYSVQGSLIKTGLVENHQISLKDIPIGLYILTLKSEENRNSFRILKQ